MEDNEKISVIERAFRIHRAILSAYMPPDVRQQDEVPQIMEAEDFGDDIKAMFIAICLLYNKVAAEPKNYIEFSHLLNNIAIELMFLDSDFANDAEKMMEKAGGTYGYVS